MFIVMEASARMPDGLARRIAHARRDPYRCAVKRIAHVNSLWHDCVRVRPGVGMHLNQRDLAVACGAVYGAPPCIAMIIVYYTCVT